jgi:hypothetical protein
MGELSDEESGLFPSKHLKIMKLLKELFKIYSPSKNEKKMRKFIKWWIKNNVPEATIMTDEIGNIYVTKGETETYPCLAAHMDQVQKIHSKDFEAIETKDYIFGFSRKNKRQEGLGADDKVGVWVNLKCLKKFDHIKAVFFVGEEVGCVGSGKCNMEFFDDCRYVIQCDRRNGDDLITTIGGWTQLCSPEFIKDIQPELFGYKEESGLITDVGELKERGLKVSAINLSCGYYEPHTDREFVIKSEVLNCLAFVRHIITTCTKTYPHEDDDYCFGRHGYGYEWDDTWSEEYEIAYNQIEYELLNHPWLSTETILNAYKGYFFALKENDLKQIIEEIKNINFIDDNDDTGMQLFPNLDTGMGGENEGVEATIV